MSGGKRVAAMAVGAGAVSLLVIFAVIVVANVLIGIQAAAVLGALVGAATFVGLVLALAPWAYGGED